MASLANMLTGDPTLKAADDALVAKMAQERPRAYLGMSSIGGNCSRKLWYEFRKVGREIFDAATLKRFRDGHITEQTVIDQLKLVDGITLIDRREDGEQIGYSDLDGHFRGHLDGDILGVLQAPKTPHVLEVKCCSDKKFRELQKAISDLGEKQALRKWNNVYYTQGMLYCHYHNRTRHYLVVATPGGRDWLGVRTDYDVAHSLQTIAKAKRIIQSDKPLDKLSNDSSYFECRYCTFNGICHSGDMPERNCRTCCHSSSVENGEWFCSRWGKKLSLDEQILGCPAQIFLPGLIPAEAIGTTETSITYKFSDGRIWTDSEAHA